MKTRTETLLTITIVILCLCAVITTSLVVRRELLSPKPTVSHATKVSDWRNFASAGHRMGPRDAPATIVVFSDFECSYCGALTRQLVALRRQYPTEVAVIYRHFPLAFHRHALEAVRASECAAAQGKFDAFHDAVFAAQDSIGIVPWEHFAALAGVTNLTAFHDCSSQTGPIPALASDTLAARRLGVRVTPTLMINEMRFDGAQPLDTLRLYVARVLRLGS
jgi:protein-disulfide isomerase